MLTDDERMRLSEAVYETLNKLVENTGDLHTYAYRLTQTFEDCVEECMRRAVKADRAGRGPAETLGVVIGLSGESVFDGDGEELAAVTPGETGLAMIQMPLIGLRKLAGPYMTRSR